MSAFPGILGFPLYGGFGFNGGLYGPALVVLDTSDRTPGAADRVKASAPIERNYTTLPMAVAGMMPGFDAAPPGDFWIYWQMRRFSTIVLAHTIVTAPILAGSQSIEIVGTPADAALAGRVKEAAERDLLPGVPDFLPGMLECLHFGHFLQEIEWGRRNGRTVPVGYHSVLPGEAVLYRDKFRRLSGFSVQGVYRDARYALLAVEQPHVDPIFGFSRNENCREEWWRIRQGEANADKMERKASGIQMGLGVPMGASFTGDDGKPVLPAEMAKTIINAAAKGETFTYPLTPFSKNDVKSNPALADIPAVKIEQFDWGNIGPAMEAHLRRGGALRTDIMRAWHRPEREAMEGTHGTKAESESHGQVGINDSETVAAQAMRQFNRQVVDLWAVTNFGPEAVGLVRMKQAPLADPQQMFLQKIATALIADRNTGPQLQSNVDQRQLLGRVEIPMVSEDEAKEKLAALTPSAPATEPEPEPAPSGPSKRPDPNLKAARRLLKKVGVARPAPQPAPGAYGLQAMSASGDAGHWVTMNGEHVLIEDGKVSKGPEDLVGKKPSQINANSKSSEGIEYRNPSKSDLKGDSIYLWHGTSADASEQILQRGELSRGSRGRNASADVKHADQYPEDTGAEHLILVKADPKSLDVDTNDQIGESVEEGLFPKGFGSSTTLGSHRVVAAFDVRGAKSGYREALQKGDFTEAKRLGVKILRPTSS